MFRSTVRHLVEICETCVPNNFVHATDVAFYFPRFQPRLHLPDCRIPEIRDAIELLQPLGKATPRRWSSPLPLSALALAEWKKNRDRALTLLSRGEEIMKNIGGARCAAAADIIRPLYATVFELINGLEHLPRSDFATRMDVHRFIVKHAGCLLYFNDSWDRSDVRHLDTACVVVAHFIRSFCALHQRPFHIKQTENSKNQSNKLPSSWTMSVEGGESSGDVLDLKMVADRLDELLQLSKEMAEKHLVESPELRWNVPKLLLLKGILSIPLTGNLTLAQNLVDSAAKTVYEFTRRKMPIVDGIVARKQEHELGLFMLSQAEMAARVFDWSIAPGEVDMEVIEMFESAAKFYSSPCNTALNADGIMSAEDLHQRRFEADAYSSCMLSYANFLLGAPRPQGTSRRDAPVFLPKQMFSTSPIATVATSSDIIYTDVRRPQAMAVEVTRKKAGEALERGLQLNRDLYPERKLNPKAGWTLVAMASLYADMRDYLYATGLFASAEKTIIENYGSVSLERLVVSKLRYEFLAGVGSEDEAKASTHEIVQLLKQMDAMPHR
ncbi:unnamed protein product [Trypanosoma congolense IL3000]|uniref:WGS project CAEQ00000000 data, annotated contig 661 n=1 Tax=Trypanosoma congolense (strain IL3000) TaxID=1068625 RepID=F9WHK3_TRYCI|nr:unnamed protein product [Trypanosoma congolense IL3000]